MTSEQLIQAGLVPIPDPSTLTTVALDREIANLQEQVGGSIGHLSDTLQEAIRHRGELVAAEFKRVDQQFILTEASRIEQKADTKAAVVDALQAAKEAVREQTTASEKAIDKTERNTADAIKALNATITASIASVFSSINDLKERFGSLDMRVTAAEAARTGNPLKERVVGIEQRTTGAKDNTAALIAGVGVVISIIGMLVILFHAFTG